jgi:periplasmic protein TonB
MSTSRMAGAPRQAAILATIGGLHIGAFVLAVAGLGPRLDWLQPAPPPFIYVQPKPPLSPPLAPRQPGPFDYSLPRQPLPDVRIPDFEPEPSLPVERHAVAEAASGSGAAVAVADVRAPSLVLHDRRMAALVDACYPAASRRLGEEGRVVIRVDVNATGRASAWNVAEGSRFARIDAAVACVIRRLEFNPGRRDGAPVAASVMLPIVFRLH